VIDTGMDVLELAELEAAIVNMVRFSEEVANIVVEKLDPFIRACYYRAQQAKVKR
jgi:hypothetical protein